MRSIRHGVPILCRTVNPSSFQCLTRGAQTAAVHKPEVPSASVKGKEKAIEVQPEAQEKLSAISQFASERKRKGCERHELSEFEAVTRLYEEKTAPGPSRSTRPHVSEVERPRQTTPVRLGKCRGQQYFSQRDRYQQFFEAVRLPPLPSTHTEVIPIKKYTRLYSPRPSSPAFRPKNAPTNPQQDILLKTKPPTRKRRAPKSNSSGQPASPHASSPTSNLSKTQSSHRKVNALSLGKQREAISPLEFAHAPIPLSYGSGDIDKRAERYRETMIHRDMNTQGVLQGLGGKEAAREQGAPSTESVGKVVEQAENLDVSQSGPSCNTSVPNQYGTLTSMSSPASRRVTSLLHGSDGKPELGTGVLSLGPPRGSRKYTSTANTNAHSHIFSPPNLSLGSNFSTPSSKIMAPSPDDSCRASMPENVAPADSKASHFDPNPVSGFSTGWRTEEWKDDWGVDHLAPRDTPSRRPRAAFISQSGNHESHRPPFRKMKGTVRPHPRSRLARSPSQQALPVPVPHSISRSLELMKLRRALFSTPRHDSSKFQAQKNVFLGRSVLTERLRMLENDGYLAPKERSGSENESLIGGVIQSQQPPTPQIPPSVIGSDAPPVKSESSGVRGIPSYEGDVLEACEDKVDHADPEDNTSQASAWLSENGEKPESLNLPPRKNKKAVREFLAAVRTITRDAAPREPAEPTRDEKDSAVQPLHYHTGAQLQYRLHQMIQEYKTKKQASTKSMTGAKENAASTAAPMSRKAAKARALALKAKAKQEFLSHFTTAQSRKEAIAVRRRKKAEALKGVIIGELKPLAPGEDVLQDIAAPREQRPIPRLAHGLDRVLFNQSVHWLQDPHSRVFNFSPNLQSLPAVTDFAFERIPQYVSSSKDEDLHTLAIRHSKQFAGSTSSLTKFLAHIYFLISGDRSVDTSTLSMAFAKEPRTFTPGLRMPATFVLHHRQNILDENGELVPSPTQVATEQAFPVKQSLSAGLQPSTPSEATASSPSSFTSSTIDDGLVEDAAILHGSRLTPEPVSPSHQPSPLLLSDSPSAKDAAEVEPSPNSNVEGMVQGSLFDKDESCQMADCSSTDEGPAENSPDVPSVPTLGAKDVDITSASSELASQTTETPGEPDGGLHPSSKPLDVAAADEPIKYTNAQEEGSRRIDTYAIDSGVGDPNERREAELNVLLWLGTMAEKLLTMSEPAFSALLRKNPVTEALVEDKRREAYRYSKSSKFVMRSQLDCQDSRLPGSGVFDIKTRAALPIRVDQLNYQENSGYLIRKMTGLFESFEREYYDLIRSAFLKYTFQARIGAMDGIFVAYHNTARMFGFQYVPVEEMEERLYGRGPANRGNKVFEKCVGLMEALVNEIVGCFPGESLSCTVEEREGAGNLRIWVIPLVWTKEEPKPIAELKVTVAHTIDGQIVSSKTAIDRANENWIMRYHISRVQRAPQKIWARLRESQQRQFTRTLPDGVAQDEMDLRLAAVNYGAGMGLKLEGEPSTKQADQAVEEQPEGEKRKERTTKRFAAPNRRVQHLRQLAQAGRADLEREEKLATRQVIWGVDADAEVLLPRDAEPCQLSVGTNVVEDAQAVDLSVFMDYGTVDTWEGRQDEGLLELVQGLGGQDPVVATTTASDQDVEDGIDPQDEQETTTLGSHGDDALKVLVVNDWTTIHNLYASYHL